MNTMEIKEIQNRGIWEKFLETCEEKSFLDSWEWGEFQRKEGNFIWRLAAYSGTIVIGCALVIKIKAKRGVFLFIPHGPIIAPSFKKEAGDIIRDLTKKIKEIAVYEKADFIRISPIFERNKENTDIFLKIGYKQAPIHMHPEITWVLDISPDIEEIFKGMRKTTRYLIKQAQKNSEIKISKSKDISGLKHFFDVYKETVERHNFSPFSMEYLKNQFSSFSKYDEIMIFNGEYRGETIASAIIVFWQGTAYYHHGASSSKYNNNKVPVSYLLQWEAINEAKNRGCSLYNFWGITPISASEKIAISSQIKNSKNQNYENLVLRSLDKKHPWYGLSLFKIGFGGYAREYVKTQDMRLSLKYYFNFLLETARRIKRRL